MSPLATSFYPAADTVESVVGEYKIQLIVFPLFSLMFCLVFFLSDYCFLTRKMLFFFKHKLL